MGFVGFLKFAFKCFDLIAWPLFGLGCPLYASIRAIENNSNSEMRNLVAYWILFSVVSLFELAFVKLIEWIPLWPYMKLVAMCLLVLPDFNGASYAYERLLRPCLSVDPRAVIKYLLIKKRAVNKYFVRSKEEKSLSAESLRALVERYAQENGYEALEKLLDQKSKHAKPDIGMEEIKAITNTEEKETAAAIQSKYQEPIVGKMDARAVEQPEKSPVAATKLSKVREPSVGKENANMGQWKDENPAVATEQVKFEDPNLVQNEKKTVATGEIKEKTAGAAGEENKAMEITLEKVQREWTCALCQMTAPSEKVLDYHLQGRKHKAKLQMLEASKQNKGSSSSADSPEPTKTLDVDRPNDNSTKKQENKVRANMTNEQCVEKESKVREPSGGKENANTGQLKDENPAVATEQVKFAYQNLVQNEEKTVATGEVKEKTVGATLEKVQREWTCALCQVTTPTEQIFDSHLQGRKHKAKLQKLEASKQNKGSSSLAASPEPKKTLDVDGPNDNSTKKQECKVRANTTNEQCVEKEVDNTGCGMAQSIFWCSICDVKCLSEIDFTSHVGGKKHISKTQEHMINAWGGGYY